MTSLSNRTNSNTSCFILMQPLNSFMQEVSQMVYQWSNIFSLCSSVDLLWEWECWHESLDDDGFLNAHSWCSDLHGHHSQIINLEKVSKRQCVHLSSQGTSLCLCPATSHGMTCPRRSSRGSLTEPGASSGGWRTTIPAPDSGKPCRSQPPYLAAARIARPSQWSLLWDSCRHLYKTAK